MTQSPEHTERRELVQAYLDDLVAQRDVDVRKILEEVIHLVLEIDDDLKRLRERAGGPDGA